MAIVVEDGSIVTGANSYVSEAELTAYATARGVTLTADEEELLIKSMDYIESLSFKGTKFTRDQELQWPRVSVYVDGYLIDADEIPQELKNGLMACAIAIDEGNDPLQDLPRQTLREKVDVIEVEYAPGSSTITLNRKVKNALWKLLASGSSGNVVTVSKA